MSGKHTPQELAVTGFTHDSEGTFGITVAEPEKVRIYRGMRLREVLPGDPANHDPEAHGGKALSQTGYVQSCARCRWLIGEYEKDHFGMAVGELASAAELALKIAEGWIHDQLDGTSALGPALAELEPVRQALSRFSPDPVRTEPGSGAV